MEFVQGEHNVSLWLYTFFKIVIVSFEFVPVQICDVSECIANVTPFFPDPDEKIVHTTSSVFDLSGPLNMRSTSCLNFFHASGSFGASQSIVGLGSE